MACRHMTETPAKSAFINTSRNTNINKSPSAVLVTLKLVFCELYWWLTAKLTPSWSVWFTKKNTYTKQYKQFYVLWLSFINIFFCQQVVNFTYEILFRFLHLTDRVCVSSLVAWPHDTWTVISKSWFSWQYSHLETHVAPVMREYVAYSRLFDGTSYEKLCFWSEYFYPFRH